MAKIRQEINISTYDFSGDAGVGDNIVAFDDREYTGIQAAEKEFEIVAKESAVGTTEVRLRRVGTTTDDATITVSGNTLTRYRTTFTPPADETVEYNIFVDRWTQVKASRLVLTQDEDPLAHTTTQIEIGNAEYTRNNTSEAPLNYPKYWTFTESNWNNGIVCYAEVVYKVTGGGQTFSARLQEDDGNWGSWTVKRTIVLGGTASSPTRVRASLSFIPVDGRHYRLVTWCKSSNKSYDIYNAKIVISQLSDPNPQQLESSTPFSGLDRFRRLAQEFKSSGNTISGVSTVLKSTGDEDLTCNLRDDLDGAILATSTIVNANLPRTHQWVMFVFEEAASVTSGVTYYAQFEIDTVFTEFQFETNRDQLYTDGNLWTWDGAGWEETDRDMRFKIHTDEISKLEPIYLIGNTQLLSTGRHEMQTRWDPSEWSGVNNKYYHEGDSTVDAASDLKLQDISGPTDIPNSFIDNCGYSTRTGEITMPGSAADIDVNVVVALAPIGASRIIVQCVLSTVNLVWFPQYEYFQNEKVDVVGYGAQ